MGPDHRPYSQKACVTHVFSLSISRNVFIRYRSQKSRTCKVDIGRLNWFTPAELEVVAAVDLWRSSDDAHQNEFKSAVQAYSDVISAESHGAQHLRSPAL